MKRQRPGRQAGRHGRYHSGGSREEQWASLRPLRKQGRLQGLEQPALLAQADASTGMNDIVAGGLVGGFGDIGSNGRKYRRGGIQE